MRAVVQAAFFPITESFEASTDHFYADLKGWVSIAKGVKADPYGTALALFDFVRCEGSTVPASPDEIRASWQAVKNAYTPLDAKRGGDHYKNTPGNTVRVTRASIERATLVLVREFETSLKKSFPDFEDWPADAQLGLLLHAWAYGEYFAPKWPKFTAAARRQAWLEVADQSKPSKAELDAQNDSFHKRVAAIGKCFRNAANTTSPATLSYPLELVA